MKNNLPIGIFDSGLGGLTVLKEVKKVLPNEDILYLGDTARVPYGTRSKDTIVKFADEDVNFLLSRDVKCIIVACGTVSSMAINKVRERAGKLAVFDLVSSSARSLSAGGCGNRVGVIGTRATVMSQAHDDAISKTIPKTKLYKKACPLIVPMVEEGETSGKTIQLVVEKCLADMRKDGLSCLVMGCTHFPLVEDIISKTMGNGVKVINPGKQLALDLKRYLENKGLVSDRKVQGKAHYFVTDLTERFQSVAEMFLEEKIDGKVERVDLLG